MSFSDSDDSTAGLNLDLVEMFQLGRETLCKCGNYIDGQQKPKRRTCKTGGACDDTKACPEHLYVKGKQKRARTEADALASTPNTMRAAVYHTFGGTIVVETIPRPSAPDDGVVLKVVEPLELLQHRPGLLEAVLEIFFPILEPRAEILELEIRIEVRVRDAFFDFDDEVRVVGRRHRREP